MPPLEQAGQKAPVFAKVAQAVTKLVESNEKTSAEALLELSTLVNAILYTQGETGLAGELDADRDHGPRPITDAGLGPRAQAAAGGADDDRLRAGWRSSRTPIERGAFRDLRLVEAGAGGARRSVSGDRRFRGRESPAALRHRRSCPSCEPSST